MSRPRSGTYVESAGPDLATRTGQQKSPTAEFLADAYVPIEPELVAAARLRVAEYAYDAEDCRELLAMLALEDES